MNIYKINLNLLKAFDALLQTQSVSKAADKLSITQPAMSNLLNQLRDLFSDEILIRRKKAMLPTAKALQLAHHVHEALQKLERVFSESEKFEPLSSTRTFTLAANDYVEYILLHKIISQLEKKAPLINLKIIPIDDIDSKELYEKQGIEIGIGISRNPDTRLIVENLFIDSSVCVVRKKHPEFSNKNRLTLKEYLSAKHLLMLPAHMHAHSLTEQALDKISAKRNIKVRMMQILPALQTLQHTNLIGTVPRSVAELAKNNFNLKIIELPISVPAVGVSLVWHNMHNDDLGHQWFRTLIMQIAKQEA